MPSSTPGHSPASAGRRQVLAHLPSPALRDRVVAAIRDAIIQGRLRPGEKVPEDELASQLGVSRTPVREAIRILEEQGLVLVRPKQGTYVARVDHLDVADGLAVRTSLEILAAHQAISRSSTGEWNATCEALAGLLDAMDRAVASADSIAATELDIQFHTAVVSASRNRYLAQTWRLVGIPLLIWTPERELYAQNQAQLVASLSDRHRALLDALRTREPSVVESAIREHLGRKLDDITAMRKEG